MHFVLKLLWTQLGQALKQKEQVSLKYGMSPITLNTTQEEKKEEKKKVEGVSKILKIKYLKPHF